MPGNSLIFKDAEKARNSITKKQSKEIATLYEQWAKEIADKAEWYKKKTTPSSALSEKQMKELEKMLRASSQQVANEVHGLIKQNIYVVADSIVQANTKWLASLGFDQSKVSAAFSSVPDKIVRKMVTGQIYESGWSLSKRIWGDNEATLKELYKIVAGGMAKNQSIYEIAKDLSKFVDPKAKKLWNLTDKDGRKIYPKQVEYNSQRLARTLVQHGYQQGFIEVTKDNPFIKEYIWRSNGSRVCEICVARDGQRYKKDQLPMDHPNGMCTMVPDVSKTLTKDLENWLNEPDGTYPEIDKFAEQFGYKSKVSAKSIGDKDNNKYTRFTESEYASWQNKNSSQKIMLENFENKYGKDDIWLEDEGVWVSELKDKLLERYNKTLFHYNGIGYVQDADGSKMINRYWRSGGDKNVLKEFYKNAKGKKLESLVEKSLKEIKETSKALDGMIGIHKLDRDLIVERWAGAKSLEKLGIEIGDIFEERIGHAFVTNGLDAEAISGRIRKDLIGAIITDDGFMSASAQSNLNVFKGSDVKFTIQVPKGVNAFITDNISESELIFGRGIKQEVIGTNVIDSEAVDYEGNKYKRKVIEIVIKIIKE